MSLKSFLAQNVVKTEHERVQISNRFIDEETGEPEYWEIRALDSYEVDALEQKATSLKRVGKTDRWEAQTDQGKFALLTMTAAVVYPDLRDAELQDSFGVSNPEDLLCRMLKPGERMRLIETCNRLNGYTQDLDSAVEQSKN